MTEYTIGFLLRQLNTAFMQHRADRTQIADITPAQAILLHALLEREKEETCAADLCEASGLSRASISGMLKLLKKKGYLTMEYIPKDERRKRIILTEKARRIQEQLNQEMKEQWECMRRGVSEEKIVVLEDILKKMIHNLKDDSETDKKERG